MASVPVATPGPITFHPVTRSDEATLWEMLYHAIHVPEGSPAPGRDILRQPEFARYVRHWGRAGDMGRVAVAGRIRQPVGATWLRLFTGDDAGYGFVDDETPELSIAVLPEYRGQGIGTQLMLDLFSAAAKRFAAVSLSVQRDNPALRLYQRMGFKTVSISGNSVIMKKSLAGGDSTGQLPPAAAT